MLEAAESKPTSVVTKRCTLIVCPVSVLSNWTDQISQFVAPGVLSVELYHGSDRYSILPQVKAGNVDVLLVSFNTLAADYDSYGKGEPKKKKAKRESIFDIDFHRIVLDEAHIIRNSKTRSFKAVSLIKADNKLALTGTPFVNTADDIYSLLCFLGVEPLNEKTIFTRAITQPIKNGDDMVRHMHCLTDNLSLSLRDSNLLCVLLKSIGSHQATYHNGLTLPSTKQTERQHQISRKRRSAMQCGVCGRRP